MKIEVNKAAAAAGAEFSAQDLVLINAQAVGELDADQVFTFKVRACDDLVDRDFERFPLETLEKLAPMFVGKTMIFDHCWSAMNQRARIYKTCVQEQDGSNVLIAECYMLRNDATKDIISLIQGGILREVSVGCAISRPVCSICGEDYGQCAHQKGAVYDGEMCVCELMDPVDAYEMSFVAVPAQPKAGVVKSVNDHGFTVADLSKAKAGLEIEKEKWRFL